MEVKEYPCEIAKDTFYRAIPWTVVEYVYKELSKGGQGLQATGES